MTQSMFVLAVSCLFLFTGCTAKSSDPLGGANVNASQLASSPTPVATVRAIDMSATTGAANGDGTFNLWSNGTVSSSVNFPKAANYLLDVTAFGSVDRGVWPIMQILVDGIVVQSFNVNSTSLSHYQINSQISSGNHVVAIGFTNDAYDAPEDRNLYVGTLAISTVASVSSADQNFLGGQFDLVSGASRSIGNVTFKMQVDGNFIAVDSSGAKVWETGTSSGCANGICKVTFQADGNLVIYNNGQPLWSTNSSGHAGSTLFLSSSAPYIKIVGPYKENLFTGTPLVSSPVVSTPVVPLPAPTPTPTPTPSPAPVVVTPPSSSSSQVTYVGGQFNLLSGNRVTVGEVYFTLQTDGNFVAYKTSTGAALWASSSSSSCVSGGCNITFQADGNLVTYKNGQPFWATNSSGHSGSTLYFMSSSPFMKIVGPNSESLYAATPIGDSTPVRTPVSTSPPVITQPPVVAPPPVVSSIPSYYVSTSGNDSNPGSINSPFKTLAKAQAAMESSSIKVATLRGGTFSVANSFTLSSADSGQSWVGFAGETAILDGGGNGGVIFNGANNMVIENLTIQNVGIGLSIVAANNVTVRWNNFLNCTTNCVKANYYCDKITVDSNTFNGGGGNGTYLAAVFMSFHITNSTVTHNFIQNFGGPGISFAAGTGSQETSTNNVIDRNRIVNTLTVSDDSGAIYILDRTHLATGYQITNNIIDTVGRGSLTTNTHSIYLDDQTSNVKVAGNTCRVCGQTALQYHGGDHNTFTNNILDLSSGSLIGLYQDDPEFGSYGMNSNTFQKNIVYFANPAPAALWSTVMTQGGSALPNVSQNNYFSAQGTAIANTNPIVDSSPSFVNPGFSGAAIGNYAMPSNSPVYAAIGFLPLASDQGPQAKPASFPQ